MTRQRTGAARAKRRHEPEAARRQRRDDRREQDHALCRRRAEPDAKLKVRHHHRLEDRTESNQRQRRSAHRGMRQHDRLHEHLPRESPARAAERESNGNFLETRAADARSWRLARFAQMMTSVTSDAKIPSADARTMTPGFTNAGLSNPTAAGMTITPVVALVAGYARASCCAKRAARFPFARDRCPARMRPTDHHPAAAASLEQIAPNPASRRRAFRAEPRSPARSRTCAFL